MVRGTVIVPSLDDLWEAYDWLRQANYFRVLTVKDRLDEENPSITITFDFDRKLIGELHFRFQKLKPQYYSWRFLN